MTLKASPVDQERLLGLQADDTRLQQLAHQAASLPQAVTAAALAAESEAVTVRLLEAQGHLEDARGELARIESDVQLVETRIERDGGRLEASSSMKDIQALEAELASLRRRRSDLEDIQLAVMEKVEELEAAEAAVLAERDELSVRLTAAVADRDEVLAGIETERAVVAERRGGLALTLPADLLELYERQRERYGIGASLLQGGVSRAAGVALTGHDLDQVRAAPPDEVLLCPVSSAILVRTSESGL